MVCQNYTTDEDMLDIKQECDLMCSATGTTRDSAACLNAAHTAGEKTITSLLK